MSTTITTPAELDALPAGTVIRDAMETGYAVCSSRGWWGIAGAGSLWESKALLLVLDEPFTVLYHPDAEPDVYDEQGQALARLLRMVDDLPAEVRDALAEAGRVTPATITAERRERIVEEVDAAACWPATPWNPPYAELSALVDAVLESLRIEVSR